MPVELPGLTDGCESESGSSQRRTGSRAATPRDVRVQQALARHLLCGPPLIARCPPSLSSHRSQAPPGRRGGRKERRRGWGQAHAPRARPAAGGGSCARASPSSPFKRRPPPLSAPLFTRTSSLGLHTPLPTTSPPPSTRPLPPPITMAPRLSTTVKALGMLLLLAVASAEPSAIQGE